MCDDTGYMTIEFELDHSTFEILEEVCIILGIAVEEYIKHAVHEKLHIDKVKIVEYKEDMEL